jgi:hypothetical protein
LTKSLPTLSRAFDKALGGDVAFTAVGFRKEPGRTTPKFLGWLFERIFDAAGLIRSDADVHAIKHVRQILQLVYKLKLEHSDESTKKVLQSFCSVQDGLKTLVVDETDAVVKRARMYITRVLSGLSPKEVIPSHGPGAVATGERGGEKSHFSRLYEDMDREYPFTEYFHLSLSHTVDCAAWLDNLEVLGTGTAKVVLVPKDSRGPRLISCEPLEKQWIQQGQRKALYSWLEQHPLTRGKVNFTDQQINRRLALSSSRDRSRVTLDMKEASDRVSLKLVRALFAGTEWLSALEASRSGYTRLPDGTVVELETFAPMGSAVCFPIEALTFWALAVSALVVHRRKPEFTPLHIAERRALASVYVYGDDIICDTKDYSIIMQQLERFGLLFNRAKCCVSGLFRESCGCDAYNGVDVTPTRLRETWCSQSRYNVVQLQSYVEFSNSMWEKGYYGTASLVREMVDGLFGNIPYLDYKEETASEYCHIDKILRRRSSPSQGKRVPPGRVIGYDASGVSPHILNRGRVRTRFNWHTHVHEVQGYSSVPDKDVWDEYGWEALLRSLNSGATGLPNGVYAIPHSSRMKRTWGSTGC